MEYRHRRFVYGKWWNYEEKKHDLFQQLFEQPFVLHVCSSTDCAVDHCTSRAIQLRIGF
jgi:hypothetical protein